VDGVIIHYQIDIGRSGHAVGKVTHMGENLLMAMASLALIDDLATYGIQGEKF
jgi:hypothetical protein